VIEEVNCDVDHKAVESGAVTGHKVGYNREEKGDRDVYILILVFEMGASGFGNDNLLLRGEIAYIPGRKIMESTSYLVVPDHIPTSTPSSTTGILSCPRSLSTS